MTTTLWVVFWFLVAWEVIGAILLLLIANDSEMDDGCKPTRQDWLLFPLFAALMPLAVLFELADYLLHPSSDNIQRRHDKRP